MDGTGDFGTRSGAALVVGANGGLGWAIARMLLERGSRVAATYRRTDSALPHEVGDDDLRCYQLDLRDADACERVVGEAAEEFGGLHTLVHAAGPPVPMVHLSKITPNQFREQILDDAVAFFNVVRPALPQLRAAAGSVVAVTTAATSRYPVRDGMSAAPKGAVEALIRALAAEEGRFGVRANCVGPGMLTDGMAQRLIRSGELDEHALAVARSNIPLRRFGSAADVAEAVCFLASDRAGFISGQKLDIDGGYGV